jgi:hypothetical protein
VVSFLWDEEHALLERIIMDKAKEFASKRSFNACGAAAL